jgi:hypothetical protein
MAVRCGRASSARPSAARRWIATPLTYRIVAALKRAENEDYFDRDTQFTPFSLRPS